MNPARSDRTSTSASVTPKGAPSQQREIPSQGKSSLPTRSRQLTTKKGTGIDRQNTKEAEEQVSDKVARSRKQLPKPSRQNDTIPPTSRSAPVDNDLGGSLERTKKKRKARKTKNVGEFDIQPNTETVKPVLKKKIDNGPSAKSAEERRNKEGRVKSVTFLTEPDAAAVAPMPPVVIKPPTKTGFTELPAKDFLVILGLWSMRFFIPWADAWHNFNFHLLREPSYWGALENDVRTREVVVFCIMSVITISVSVLADFVNCRFFIYLILLLFFVLCPLTGGILNGVLVARAYNQDFYRAWALTSDTLFHCAFATAYVSFPVQLSCIFGQIDGMSRQAHYNWTAVLVFFESVNRYIAFWVIPGKCPTKTFTQSAIWFLIGVLILIVFLFVSNFVLDWAKPEILHSKWYAQESTTYKEQNDLDNNDKRIKKLIWFLSILTFILITSFVFATLERLKPDEEWDKHSILSATSMFLLGEIMGAAFMVIILSIVRWNFQYYYYFPFLRPDVLALGLPHIINLIALVVLLGRFATLSSLKEGDVIIGPIPENKKMVVEFYNFDYRNRTVCVHSTFFRPLKISPRQRGTREIYDLGVSRIHFTVTLDPQTTPGLTITDSFEYQDNTWTTFLITLPLSNIKYSDIRALYSKPETVRVEGTQRLRPRKKSQVFFMNTFVTDNSSKFMWMFLVRQSSSGFQYEFRHNLRWQTVIIEVPNGPLEIIYHLVHSTLPPQTVQTTIDAEDYSVWAVLLGHSGPMTTDDKYPVKMLKAFKTMETAGPHSVRLPGKAQLQRDPVIMAGMTMAGMASSGIFIGMIYLFWLDTPFVAIRTICIGVFWVLVRTPAELSNIKVVDIGVIVISVLAFLQIICVILHFIAAERLYTPKFNFRERLD